MMTAGAKLFSMHDAHFWQEIGHDRLSLQKCTECGEFRYPPSSCCATCLSVDHEWTEMSGRAKVISWTTFHRQYLPAYPSPSTVLVAQLEEGPMMITNVVADDVDYLTLDAPLEVEFTTHPDQFRLPTFRLAARKKA